MSEALRFFHAEEVRRLLDRGARAAAAPLSVHFVERNQEGACLVSCGESPVCRQVNATEAGRKACRASRIVSASLARSSGLIAPFICHLGFACLSLAPLPDRQYILTIGPFCSVDQASTLEEDAERGWAALEVGEAFPADDLKAIHCCPPSAVTAIADWLVEALNRVWEQSGELEPPAQESPPQETPPLPGVVAASASSPPPAAPASPAVEMALALAAAKPAQARSSFSSYLEGLPGKTRKKLDAHRSSAIACVAAVGEAAEAAGLSTGRFWKAFPGYAELVWECEDQAALCDASMRLLSLIHPKQRSTARPDQAAHRGIRQAFPELTRILEEAMASGITLNKVAAQLGEQPSTISHRLEREYHLSFTEYLGWLRVQEARKLLRQKRLSLAEVGRRVGVADQSNFSKVFKRHTGMTPKAYRAQWEEK